jgi:hypothetical protein
MRSLSLLAQGFCSNVGATAEVANRFVAGGAGAQKQVFWWLVGCTGWVFSMVILGGYVQVAVVLRNLRSAYDFEV